MRRIIWWVRRDLRLADNVTLYHALQDSASVIPVFILDPHLVESEALAPVRRRFLYDSLRDLDLQLGRHSSRLILRRGEPARELMRVVRETGAEAVYFHRDYTPYARARDEPTGAALAALGVKVEPFEDNYMAPPGLVVKPDGSPYVVYTPYRRRFEEQSMLPGPLAEPGDLHTPPDLRFARPARCRGRTQSARGAGRRDRGAAAGTCFSDAGRRSQALPGRARPDGAGCDLSSFAAPAFWHNLGPGMGASRARGAGGRAGADVDRRTGVARVFRGGDVAIPARRRAILSERVRSNRVGKRSGSVQGLVPGMHRLPGSRRGDAPIERDRVMHNRARLVVASFLVKDLLVDWRWGERYFLQHLVDGDVASNNGGWQWSAGTGTDAQPFFRILNPVLQGKRFDPDGEYVKRWVPELERVPARHVHEPWRMPADAARQARFEPGRDYVLPVVDHAVQRERALALYRSVR